MRKYPNLKFICDNKEGVFDWGEERDVLWERLYHAEDIDDIEEYILELRSIIEEDPEFIAAYNGLGGLEISLNNYGNALLIFETAYKIAKKYIPRDFKGRIPWGFIDNRPFLRTLNGLGHVYLFIREWRKASLIFEKILKYNPDDNQGIRSLAIHSYIAQGKFKNVLKICRNYPNDILPDVPYGKVLAYYRLDKLEKAKKALEEAIEISPNVAKELIKSRHKKPLDDGSITLGGEEEAYYYWKQLGEYWTDVKLKKLIKETLEEKLGANLE